MVAYVSDTRRNRYRPKRISIKLKRISIKHRVGNCLDIFAQNNVNRTIYRRIVRLSQNRESITHLEIVRINYDRIDGAIIEGMFTDLGNTAVQAYGPEVTAIIECVFANLSDSTGNLIVTPDVWRFRINRRFIKAVNISIYDFCIVRRIDYTIR